MAAGLTGLLSFRLLADVARQWLCLRRLHDYRFLSAAAVNGNRAIEVGLANAHRYRHGEALRQFIGTGASNVDANDFVVVAGAYRFPARSHRVPGPGVSQA
jgi:hypothetical protein